MNQINRAILSQPFSPFVLAVGTTPTPIKATANKSDLVDSFIVSLDAGAANNVFMGDGGVTINSGIEIVAGGGPVNFLLRNQKQQYDLQIPLLAALRTLQCQDENPFAIPFLVWDCSQIYFIAAAATNVRIALFNNQFV